MTAIQILLETAAGQLIQKTSATTPVQPGQAAQLKVVANSKASVLVDGAPLTGKQTVNGKIVSLKKVGKNLLLEADGSTLAELVDFYAVEGASLSGEAWTFAATDGLVSSAAGVAATPEALAESAAMSGAGAAATLGAGISSATLGLGALGALVVASLGGGSANPPTSPVPKEEPTTIPPTTPPTTPAATTVTLGGRTTAGQSSAGLLVEVFDKDGKPVLGADGKAVTTTTDAKGDYTLSIPKTYAGQALSLKVTDPDKGDGKGYIDEATGESKDFGTALRSALVLSADKDQQTAQISPLTELAARKTLSADGSIAKTAQQVQDTNKAIAQLFGLDDIDTTTPDVVGKGDGGGTSNGYGKALALLSGMDAINERLGAADPMDATLDRLAQAITLKGGVSAQFSSSDVDTLNLLSQAVAEVAATNTDTSLVDALANIALDAAKTGLTDTAAKTLFITSQDNLLGAGKETAVSFRFDGVPAASDVDKLKAQLQISGGSLSDPQKSSTDASIYTATFTQRGSDTPKVWVSGTGFFSNELHMQLDTLAPTLSAARIEGLGTDGVAKGILKAGDTVRVTLNADESVLVSGTPVLKLKVGGTEVDATYNSAASGTRNLVFTYTIAGSLNDTDGVSVDSLSLGTNVTLTDFAGNAAQLNSAYSGLTPIVDTVAPVVISQAPLDGSTVGNAGAQTLTLNFSEVVRLGAGTLTLKRGDATVQTLDINAGTLAADGQSVSFALPTATLTAGSYTVTASAGAFVDAAGNALSGELAAGGWDFTVGAVTLGISKVSTDNLLNNTEADGALTLNGTLAGDATVLQSITAADLQVWLKPAAGGVAVQATVSTLANGAWSAEVSDASALTGGYIVQAFINKDTVKSSASSVIVVDRTAQMALGTVAGDNVVSLLEQSIAQSGKTIALPFAAEKGASGTVTLTNGDKTVTKTFSNATGTVDTTSLGLSAADLTALGTGAINVSAKVTDVAGNQATISKTFTIDAPAVAAKVVAVQLTGSNSTAAQQALGDKVLASVSFDKAITLSGTDLDLNLTVGSATRVARFVGLSADRRSLNFEYTVQTGDTDTDGVTLAAATALRLGTGVALKDLSGLSAATALPTSAQGTVQVNATADAAPDLAVSVTEAGLNAAGTFMAGTPSASGKLVTNNGETVTKVKFGENATDIPVPAGSTATSLGAALVQGKFGTWRVGANGSYTYSLNNTDTDTQALAAGDADTDVLTFVTSAAEASKTLTVTVTGTNDAPMVSAALATSANEGSSSSVSLSLLSNATDPDANPLSVADITYKVGAGTASSTLPAGLTLSQDGKTLTLDPANAAFNTLKAGVTQTITANYNLKDGLGANVAQTATFTVTGSNDKPSVSYALAKTIIEGAAATSINLLTDATDADGDPLAVSGLTFKVGDGDGSPTLPAGLSLMGTSVLSIDPSNTAFNSLKQGETVVITASYNVTDGQGSNVAQTATFTITGTNDAPTVSAALAQSATEGNSTAATIDLLTNATDPDANTSLSVADITYKVGTGEASTTLPAGLTLSADGKTLTLDPANAAFNSLKAGATQTIAASYTITDDQGASVAQTATFTVTGSNDAPTAVGSVDAQTAVKAQPYSLDVSSYFADVDAGDTRSYALSGAGAAGLSIDASGKITGTLGATRVAQDLTVTLTDGSGATASQTINLRVVDKPVVQSIALAEGQSAIVKGASTVQLAIILSEAVTVSGEGIPTLTLSINGQSTTATYQSGSGTNKLVFSATVPSTNGSAITISAINVPTGTSIQGNTSGQTLLATTVGQSTTALTIDSTNPVISTTALNVAENATTVATLSATDATALKWTLAEGGTDNALFSLSEAGALTLNAAKDFEVDAKTYSIQVQATDAAGNSSSQTLSVNLTDVNEAPTALALNNTTPSLAENASTTARTKVADIAVTDDALGTNALTLEGTDAAFFEIDNKTLYLKAATALDFESKTSYAVTVKAQDSSVAGSQALSQSFTLSITNVNEAPTVSAALSKTATEGDSSVNLNLLSNATDPDASTSLSVVDITYKVGTGTASSTLPAGLTLSPDGKILTLDPANAAFNSLKAGATQTITASYNVKDEQGATVAQTATFTLTGANDAPTVLSELLHQSVDESSTVVSLNLLGGAEDADGDTLNVTGLTYQVGESSASSVIPAGLTLTDSTLSLDPANPAFNSLKAGAIQTITASYYVTDGQGGSVAQTATFTVIGTNDAPVASVIAPPAVVVGQSYAGYTVPAFTDPDGDALTYTATQSDGSALPTWLVFDAATRAFSVSTTSGLSAETLSLKVTASDGTVSTDAAFSLTVTADSTPPTLPTASTVASEAPSAYDRGVVTGATADSMRVRFSESVNVDLLQQAMAQGKIQLQGANGETRNMGTGAVFEPHTPGQIVVSGLSDAANGTYTSLWTGSTNSETPTFASGFGLTTASNANLDVNSVIYKKTNIDGSVWYIWTQVSEGQWIISQSSPVDANGNPQDWYLSNITLSTSPLMRSGVLGVSRWNAKSGALAQDEDPWANATVVSSADLEPNGNGRTFTLALGAGHNAQAGDTLVIDKSFVKDSDNNLAASDISFVLPSDITRPTVSASAAAQVQGIGSAGAVKTSALVVGDTVRVTVQMAEAVTVSGTSAAVTLELDAGSRQATINRTLSFANGATSSTALVFDYVVKEGDSDQQGGISLGAFNRNSSTIRDASGNRFYSVTDLTEGSNSLSIAADGTGPTLVSTYNSDKAIVAGATGDTLNFKFSELVNVDNLETAFANGQVRVTSADGSAVRNLGAGAKVEATYPSTIEVAGFSTAANGTYTSLWSAANSKNIGAPSFSGFSTNGVALVVDVSQYAIYKHTDSAGQDWYLWRPNGWSNYVLTPQSSVINGVAQDWWASGNGAGLGTDSTAREGVLLAGDWYANSGQLSSSQSMWPTSGKLSSQPSLEASGWGVTFTLALGNGHTVQQGDKIVVDAGAARDINNNANSASIEINLPADITRPVLGDALVKGYKAVWNSQTTSYVYTESATLTQNDVIRVEIPLGETIKLYTSGGSSGWVVLDIGGQTRYASLNLQLSSSTGSTVSGFASNKLVYEYWVQAGDNDTQGGITVGAMIKGTVGMYDAANNRPWAPSDVPEASNSITVVDATPPTLWVGYASGTTVVLQASEALDTSKLPSTSAFTVNGQSVTVSSVAAVVGDPKAVLLTLATPVTVGQNVQVSYTDPSTANDTNALQDLAGNDAASISNYVVTASTAPTIQYAQTGIETIELADGGSELWFHLKYSDVVSITGTPRLALSVKDGSNTTTAYADFQPYEGVTNGQNTLSFMYKPTAGTQGQVHVSSLDLNGGSITAYGSAGTVPASTTLGANDFFTPYTWIYPTVTSTGSEANNLIAPWMQAPQDTPLTLTSTTVQGNGGNRDVLLMSVLLPQSVTTEAAATAYRLDYNLTAEGVRQVLLKNGSTTVQTYTVPANAGWPSGVEQIMFHAVFKDSTGKVQFTDIDNVLLTAQQAEYVDPINANHIWLQGTLDGDVIDLRTRANAQRIYIDAAQGNDTITGHDGVDLINGGGGTNTISAGLGNDTVMVRNGNGDLVDGGTGSDTLRFDLAGQEKKITVDDQGVIHVYSANGTWSNGFVPDSNGWVERYRLSTDYGTDGTNRLAVFDVARDRVVTSAKNMEQLQWRLDDNMSGRATSKYGVGSAGGDTIDGLDVVLAGAGDDTIILTGTELHTYDWRNGDRPLLINGGTGRDVLQLNTSVSGMLSQVFESQTVANPSRMLQNLEGLNLTQGGYVQLAAADVASLVGSNTNAWSGITDGTGKQQFVVMGSMGSLSLTDTNGWTQKSATVTSSVSGTSQSYKVLEHTSGVQLLVDQRVGASGAITYEGGGGTTPTPGGTSLSISSYTTNGQMTEGNSGTTQATFAVARSGDTTGATSVNWSLVNLGTDISDFATGQATSGSLSFAAGETLKTIDVLVAGDTLSESNETFSIRLASPTNNASLSFAETQVVILNDDGGSSASPVTTPAVMRVRSEDNRFIFPNDGGARFTVEMSDSVRITGTPQLQLTLKSPDGSQTKTVQANFKNYSGTTTESVQTTLEFVYDYTTADANLAGWQLHIDSLSLNGGSINHSANTTVNANLALNRVAITAGDWLLGSGSVVMNSATGTAYNDVILPWESDPASAPNTLSGSSTFNNVAIHGGAGDRDVLGVPFMLPDTVTTQAQANEYYLSYASNNDGTVRTVSLYKAGEATAIKTFTVPNFSNSLSINDWPAEIEAMAFYVQYHDAAANENRGVDGPGTFIEQWKNGYTSTDPINGDVYKQGSFRSDTIDVSGTAADKRVLIKAGYGSDAITGHAGADVILGEGGSDTINAGEGDDMVMLSGGADAINGGGGNDALGLYLHGAQARATVDSTHRLHIKSANGSWIGGEYVPDAAGFTSDWVFSFDQATPGNIAAKRFAGGVEQADTTTATGIEGLYLEFANNKETFGVPLDWGTSGADTLTASDSPDSIMLGLAGNDTFEVDSNWRPIMLGGDGDDSFLLKAAGLTQGNGLEIHGGAGTDAVVLGSDVQGAVLSQPSDSAAQFTSFEVVDLTGSTASGAAGNTLELTAAWMREFTDLLSGARSLTVKGDANDMVSLLNADSWALQNSSTQAGYAHYTATASNEVLNLFVVDAIKNASGGVILA